LIEVIEDADTVLGIGGSKGFGMDMNDSEGERGGANASLDEDKPLFLGEACM
jgi:hypothetical protein